MNLCLPAIYILLQIRLVLNQFIFENQNFCKFSFKEESIIMPDSIINFTIGNRQFFISPCTAKISNENCKTGSRACISNRNNMINAGSAFFLTKDEDELVLKSSSGDACNSGDNYVISIYFECSSNMKVTPTLIESDGCEFKIRMVHPNCNEVKCTSRVDGYLIDVQKFKNKDIEFKTGNKSFHLSLCGSPKKCNDNTISACEEFENGPRSIGTVSSQHVHYDTKTKRLLVRMNYGSKRYRISAEVYVKCNWKALNINPKVTNIRSSKFFYQIESPIGCIKLPMNCVVFKNNLIYNLTSLYNLNNWIAKNITGLKLNMCGPLYEKNICAETHAQICLNDATNFGSVLTSLEQIEEGHLRARLSDGDVCSEDATQTLYTEIDFKCSKKESGPVFKNKNVCSMYIDWETPKACPSRIYTGDNCMVTDFAGRRNLSGVYTSGDRIHPLSRNSFIRYNLCGILHKPCNNQSVSACYIYNNKEFVLGHKFSQIKSTNGALSMELKGGKCDKFNNNASLNVDFHCNYSSPHIGDNAYVKVLQDSCSYNLNLMTPLACDPAEKVSCIVGNGNLEYNLNPLGLLDKNYIIKNNEENVVYILNICRPVVKTSSSMCPAKSAACLQNITEPNPIKQFTSLGILSNPVVINNELILKYKHGKLCMELVKDIETTIIFKCGRGTGKPKLIQKKDCEYTFEWNTIHACPKIKRTVKRHTNCTVNDTDSGNRL